VSSDELAKLGFQFDPAFDHLLELELRNAMEVAQFSADEVAVVRSIMRAKACDAALLSTGNTNVGVTNWLAVRDFCIPFVVPCARTTILGNPNASASVLTAGDVRILEVSEITTNEQLASTDAEKLAARIVETVERSVRQFNFPKDLFQILQKRIELWKIQASLLWSRQFAANTSGFGEFGPNFQTGPSARTRNP
jgi:hypothetical protein